MVVAIVKILLENWDKPGLESLFYSSNFNKFLLKTFNRLSHNSKVSEPLVL